MAKLSINDIRRRIKQASETGQASCDIGIEGAFLVLFAGMSLNERKHISKRKSEGRRRPNSSSKKRARWPRTVIF